MFAGETQRNAKTLDNRKFSTLEKNEKFNVLFIMVDDLRPQLGCYGYRKMITPNLERLANQGMTFQQAYCQQALCTPSRASLLSKLSAFTNLI